VHVTVGGCQRKVRNIYGEDYMGIVRFFLEAVVLEGYIIICFLMILLDIGYLMYDRYY